jgi:hypothetical protein
LLEFAVVDFFHSENIPDRVVESSWFQHLLKVAHLVGDDFVCPNQRKVGGELLNRNLQTKYKANKTRTFEGGSSIWVGLYR